MFNEIKNGSIEAIFDDSYLSKDDEVVTKIILITCEYIHMNESIYTYMHTHINISI
jgi:hypothetical protein